MDKNKGFEVPASLQGVPVFFALLEVQVHALDGNAFWACNAALESLTCHYPHIDKATIEIQSMRNDTAIQYRKASDKNFINLMQHTARMHDTYTLILAIVEAHRLLQDALLRSQER